MTWVDFAAAAWGFAGGITGWSTTTFVVQPIVGALNARSEAAQNLAKFATFDCHEPIEGFPVKESEIEDRRRAYVDCGAKLSGFDLSYPFLAKRLRGLGLNFRAGGGHLMSLGRMTPGSPSVEIVRDSAMRSLGLGRRFGRSNARV